MKKKAIGEMNKKKKRKRDAKSVKCNAKVDKYKSAGLK